MPLSDQDVTSVMDWLGRTQPVGQQQLSLTTATGGAPSGGPVTPGGGVIAPDAGPPAPGGRGVRSGGGASPLTQAVGVADLVRRAAGLIPTAAEVPGSLGGPGAFGAQIEAQGGAQGLRTLGTTTGGLEAGGAELGAAGAAESPAMLGTEAAGGGAGLGAAATGLGGAAGLGFGIKSALEAQTDVGKAGGALSATGGALALASIVQPELLPFAILVSLLGGGTSTLGGMFGGKPGVYDIKRKGAEATGQAGAAGLAAAQLRALQSGGDPAAALSALSLTTPDRSSIPGRNPVRSYLNLPPDVAASLGLPTDRAIQWHDMNTDQFTRFMALYAANPDTFSSYVGGSGDVAYLQQGPAEALAAQTAAQARDFLGKFSAEMTAAGGPASPVGGEAAAPSVPAGGPAGPGMTPGGPAGALGFSRDLLQAA